MATARSEKKLGKKTKEVPGRRWVNGRDLKRHGGCQGYMEIFSEVFCVVSFIYFFNLLYIFAHQETPRWKRSSKTQ